MAMIDVQNLNVDSRLNGINLSVNRGELIGIIGPNGAGKSSLIKALLGLVDNTGSLFFDGALITHPHTRATTFAYLPQRQEVHWSLSVRDVVTLGRAPHAFEQLNWVETAMTLCQVEHLSHRDINSLSGGEQARVHLARAIATQAPVLIADEPLASLDFLFQKQIMQVLNDYTQPDRCVILSIHDLSLAARYCDHIILLDRGTIFAQGKPQDVLTQTNLKQVYGVDTFIDLERSPPIIVAI